MGLAARIASSVGHVVGQCTGSINHAWIFSRAEMPQPRIERSPVGVKGAGEVRTCGNSGGLVWARCGRTVAHLAHLVWLVGEGEARQDAEDGKAQVPKVEPLVLRCEAVLGESRGREDQAHPARAHQDRERFHEALAPSRALAPPIAFMFFACPRSLCCISGLSSAKCLLALGWLVDGVIFFLARTCWQPWVETTSEQRVQPHPTRDARRLYATGEI